jgi:hypothetical protein
MIGDLQPSRKSTGAVLCEPTALAAGVQVLSLPLRGLRLVTSAQLTASSTAPRPDAVAAGRGLLHERKTIYVQTELPLSSLRLDSPPSAELGTGNGE